MTDEQKKKVSRVLNHAAAAMMLGGAGLVVGAVYVMLGTGAALLVGGVIVFMLGISAGIASKNV